MAAQVNEIAKDTQPSHSLQIYMSTVMVNDHAQTYMYMCKSRGMVCEIILVNLHVQPSCGLIKNMYHLGLSTSTIL